MRWTDRLIGLISTLILARLLVPADFGIVAMASIVVGLADTLLDLGVGSALIQNRHAGRDHFDTAWTLRLAQGALAALAIWFAAPFAAESFHDPRVLDVVRFMALSVFLGGFENIGIVSFQKNMEFGQDFRFLFLRRVSGFVVTIVLAFVLRSYWAMVIGALFGRFAGIGLSYLLHDYRPRLSLVKVRDLWSFSQWILVRNLGAYGLLQLDKFLIGQRTDAATMGAYSLADEVASMPTTELLAPLGRVLFPVFVKVAHDAELLRIAFCKALGVQCLFALPAGVGLALVAEEAVPLLLGEQWLPAIPLVKTLALISVFTALSHSSGYVLLALGKVWFQAMLSWLQLALLACLALVFFPDIGAQGIASIRLATTALGFCLFIGLVLYYVKSIRFTDIFIHTWRPLCATGVMALVLLNLPRPVLFGHFGMFVLHVGCGAAVYAIFTLFLWRMTGCREGAESYLFDLLKIKERLFLWMRVSK
ncbi:MAG: lipopolysaccharide biosynthesis protein [Betaproteobacteria bacterium HGW-Betaproteobacteria-10]|nr:MAG: lipopolysaccharide biosynthesis protein [Betaproteobacteria bacterium HGW-Betaproteobacteria-10]